MKSIVLVVIPHREQFPLLRTLLKSIKKRYDKIFLLELFSEEGKHDFIYKDCTETETVRQVLANLSGNVKKETRDIVAKIYPETKRCTGVNLNALLFTKFTYNLYQPFIRAILLFEELEKNHGLNSVILFSTNFPIRVKSCWYRNVKVEVKPIPLSYMVYYYARKIKIELKLKLSLTAKRVFKVFKQKQENTTFNPVNKERVCFFISKKWGMNDFTPFADNLNKSKVCDCELVTLGPAKYFTGLEGTIRFDDYIEKSRIDRRYRITDIKKVKKCTPKALKDFLSCGSIYKLYRLSIKRLLKESNGYFRRNSRLKNAAIKLSGNRKISVVVSHNLRGFFPYTYLEMRNVKRLLFQHSADPTFFANNSGICMPADYYLVWGEYVRNFLVKNGVEKEKIVITGSTRFDRLLDSKKSEDIPDEYFGEETKLKRVIFFSQIAPFWTVELIKAILNVKEKQNFIFILRPRPEERLSKFLSGLKSKKEILMVMDFSSGQIIKASDIVITFSHSTIVLEALLLKKEIISFSPFKDIPLISRSADKLLWNVSSLKQIQVILKDIINHKLSKRSELINVKTLKPIYDIRIKPADRFTGLIKKLTAKD